MSAPGKREPSGTRGRPARRGGPARTGPARSGATKRTVSRAREEAPLSPSAARILALYREGGIASPPGPKAAADLLGIKRQIAAGLIAHLVARGDLLELPGDWLVSREAVAEAAARLRASDLETIDVATFKTLFGLTRRLGIPLLDHFAATGVVAREGSVNRILRP